jgi:hypothetical protein
VRKKDRIRRFLNFFLRWRLRSVFLGLLRAIRPHFFQNFPQGNKNCRWGGRRLRDCRETFELLAFWEKIDYKITHAFWVKERVLGSSCGKLRKAGKNEAYYFLSLT